MLLTNCESIYWALAPDIWSKIMSQSHQYRQCSLLHIFHYISVLTTTPPIDWRLAAEWANKGIDWPSIFRVCFYDFFSVWSPVNDISMISYPFSCCSIFEQGKFAVEQGFINWWGGCTVFQCGRAILENILSQDFF